ncbi:MAG: sugar ABC transporter permease [Lachnospiraceae bacterium]|nr:sugar ABC transporter permease [Lachnospiraceae bacterium]
MKKEKKKRTYKLITRTDIIGYLFVLPFLIGFLFLFLKPMVTSVIYSFHKITFGESGMIMEKVGLENYRYALFGDAKFFKELLTIGGTVVVKILVIMFMSIFVALLLNQKFPGRLFFRTVMFLPVIFGADTILKLFIETDAYQSLSGSSNAFVSVGQSATGFLQELIQSFGFFSDMMSTFSEYAKKIFDLTWEMGIQVILFIVGLQAIPSYLYEVCEMEGATKWETFWKITFPLLSPTILLCLIYTVIENFNSSNEVVKMISENMGHRIHYACAQTWLYSIIVFLLVMIIYGIVSRKTVYLD